MEQVWNIMIAERQAGIDAIQLLISMNIEESQECLIEYIDEVSSDTLFLEQIKRLKVERNHLFDVKDDLEQAIERLQGYIDSVAERAAE